MSVNNARNIASSNDNLHIVWYDFRQGNFEILYNRSTNSGIEWGQEIRLTNNLSDSRLPSVAVSGTIVHVIWQDQRDLNYEIYYKRSTNNGVDWSPDIRLTSNTSESWYPVIAASGSFVHIAWRDNRDGNREIYYKRSTDNGSIWSQDTRFTSSTLNSDFPSLETNGSSVFLIWQDFEPGNWEIFFKSSSDYGTNWSSGSRLTFDSAYSVNPSLSVSGTNLHVVWNDFRDNNDEIYYKNSLNNGQTWSNDIRISDNPAPSLRPSVYAKMTFVHIVWIDPRDGNSEIYYKFSSNNGTNWNTDTRLTNNLEVSYSPSINVSNSVVNVLWEDDQDGNNEIYYKRNPTGNPIGITPISTKIPKSYSLSQNYPNPFNPVTKIRFSLPQSGNARLTVYDALGKEIKLLVNENLQAGIYEADFDASNIPSGVYYYRMEVNTPRSVKSEHPSQEGNYIETRKMVVVK